MIALPNRPAIAALCLLALPLAACGGDAGGSSTAPRPPSTSASCAPTTTVDLQPGQTASLTAAQAACFQLAPHAGARYALAGFDTRAIEGAQAGPEPSISDQPSYVVGDGTSLAPSPAPNADRLLASAAPRVDVQLRADASLDANTPFSRATPWAAGERFPIRRLTGEAATARVVRVMGRYVFALVEGPEEGHTDRFISDTEKAMDYLVREGEAVLDRTWGAQRPVTSAGSGQMLIVYDAWNPDLGMGSAITSAVADGIGTYIWLNLDVRPGVRDNYALIDVPSFRLKVLAHELTHAWQMRYAYTSQPAGARVLPFGPAWAMEGTADLVAMDIVRRSLGVSLTANWSWENRFASPSANVTYALQPADTRGRLSRGYYDGASFLQDVQVRMTRRGASADEALAQVARGAVEGWYGIDAAGVRRQGLAERVRAVLGPEWNPADAVLLWTLTQASDDQTDAAELNNPVYDHVTDSANPNAWKPAIDEVQAGRGFAYQVTRGAGTSFFVRMKDAGQGGTVALTATVAGTRWMVARRK